MKPLYYALPLALLMLLASLLPLKTAAADEANPLDGDALHAPRRTGTLAVAGDPRPSLYQPSAFLAGRVAVQLLFVESDGSREPSRQNWTDEQMSVVREQVAGALEWWRVRLPKADLSFDLTTKVASTGYEPIGHTLSTEGAWIGDSLTRLGVAGANYFDQAYLADSQLRSARGADWATTIFIVNSTGANGGRFADGRFAYAYINGPFMVVTSDAGPYGLRQMAPVVAHEFGHIFGALDQYASAGTPCTQLSGYLAVPTTNSQANDCGTHYSSIMLDPLGAYASYQVDDSALGQLGYRDSDGDGLPDPIDTAPAITFSLAQAPAGKRPALVASVIDQPYPSPMEDPVTINTVDRVEYRVDGGNWFMLAPSDGAYDGAVEDVSATLPLYDGRHTVDVRAFNSRGAASPVGSAMVVVSGVGTAPAYRADVPAVSDSETIAVSLSAPAGASVQIGEDPLFTGLSWVPASSDIAWRLSSSDGPHRLYVRFREANGLESQPYLKTVLLDRTPPSGRVVEHSGATPWIEIQAEDSLSGVAAMQMLDAGGNASAWQPFQSSLPVTLASSSIRVRVRDAAGNVSAPLAVYNGLVYLAMVAQ